MDLTFSCPKCHQDMVVDSSGAGSEVECPACGALVTVPSPASHVLNPIASSAAAKEDRHYSVPVHEKPAEAEVLIEKPKAPLEVAAKESDKRLRTRCIKRSECVEVGKDRFDEVVTEFLGKVGETNVVSLHTIAYTHQDMATRAFLTDYGIMIVYKG